MALTKAGIQLNDNEDIVLPCDYIIFVNIIPELQKFPFKMNLFLTSIDFVVVLVLMGVREAITLQIVNTVGSIWFLANSRTTTELVLLLLGIVVTTTEGRLS
uniref:Uncharacterized protein n=1 Tax=Glossina pallidipes TaxID=7398 RepID=A0A1B0A7P3_GLOPL